MAKCDHGLDDLLIGFVEGNPADESLVDLDLARRELLQIGQRGIALTEIVDRQIDPNLA
ncbi:hypothetical protein D3C83_49160 [compost metagenome]